MSPSVGIMTAPSQVDYDDVLRVWREADGLDVIEHAWLYDHLFPIFGELTGPSYEAWTLLSALAASTSRLRLGVLVTSNRFRAPAMLAKMAATVDAVSDGRLDVGIGAGSRPDVPFAHREYEAHGVPFHDGPHAVAALAEGLAAMRRLWTSDEPFDVDGEHVRLTGAFGNPKPVQKPHPPILVGGRATATLRIAAEHADIANIPAGGVDDAAARSAVLDRLCAEIGRDPASLTRSIVLGVDWERPRDTQDEMRRAVDAGFSHLVLSLMPPYPEKAATRVAEEVIPSSW